MKQFFLNAMLLTSMLLGTLAVAEGAATPGAARVVSTDAAATEILRLLGEGDRLVAVDSASELPAGRELPRLGYHRALSAEGLIALAPDLVIGSEHMGPPHVIETLARAEVPVLRLPSPHDLSQLESNIAAIARATGSDRAAAVLDSIALRREQLRKRALSGLTAAFILRGEGGKLRLAGAGTAGDGFIALLGAGNVAGHDNYRSISPEGLLALSPDLLLVADTEGADVNDLLMRHPVLRFSAAVNDGRAYPIDAATLVAGLSVAAIEEAGRILDAAAPLVARH